MVDSKICKKQLKIFVPVGNDIKFVAPVEALVSLSKPAVYIRCTPNKISKKRNR